MTKDFRLTSLLKKVKNIKLYELSGRTVGAKTRTDAFPQTPSFYSSVNYEVEIHPLPFTK